LSETYPAGTLLDNLAGKLPVALDPSGAPVTDCDLIAFEDNGHLSRALGVLQHLLELCRVRVDIVILSIAVG